MISLTHPTCRQHLTEVTICLLVPARDFFGIEAPDAALESLTAAGVKHGGTVSLTGPLMISDARMSPMWSLLTAISNACY